MTVQEKHEALFVQLVAMFHAATMSQLGKTPNPMTGGIERDLQAAQGSIDVLDMLLEKTKGNLTTNEQRFLGQMLKELKLNYVDEAAKPAMAPEEKNPEDKPSQETKT